MRFSDSEVVQILGLWGLIFLPLFNPLGHAILTSFFFNHLCNLKKIFDLFIYQLYWIFIAAQAFLHGLFSSCDEWGLLFVSVHGLLVASHCGTWALGHISCSFWTQEYRLSCGIFQDQRFNRSLLHWQAGSLPLSHQGGPWPPIKVSPC